MRGLIARQRSGSHECKVIITLTPKGRQLQAEAAPIPEQRVSGLVSEDITVGDLEKLKDQLSDTIRYLSDKSGVVGGKSVESV